MDTAALEAKIKVLRLKFERTEKVAAKMSQAETPILTYNPEEKILKKLTIDTFRLAWKWLGSTKRWIRERLPILTKCNPRRALPRVLVFAQVDRNCSRLWNLQRNWVGLGNEYCFVQTVRRPSDLTTKMRLPLFLTIPAIPKVRTPKSNRFLSFLKRAEARSSATGNSAFGSEPLLARLLRSFA